MAMAQGVDREEIRRRVVDAIVACGEYVSSHAEDFVCAAGSDELVSEGGLTITLRVSPLSVATAELRREVLVQRVPTADGGLRAVVP